MASVTNVIIELEQWLKEPDCSTARSLAAVAALEKGLEGNEEASRANLERTKKPEHIQVIEANMQTFEAVYCLLPTLREALDQENKEAVKGIVAQLNTLREELLIQHASMAALGGQVRYCPRCGKKTQDICEACQLEALDPAPPPKPTETVELGPYHSLIYEVYVKVLSGEITLSNLTPPLNAFESLLKEIQAEVVVASQERAGQAAREMPEVVKSSLGAVQTMRRGVTTRSVADLHAGWRQLFDDAQMLESFLPRLQASVEEFESLLDE